MTEWLLMARAADIADAVFAEQKKRNALGFGDEAEAPKGHSAEDVLSGLYDNFKSGEDEDAE